MLGIKLIQNLVDAFHHAGDVGYRDYNKVVMYPLMGKNALKGTQTNKLEVKDANDAS